MKKVNRYYMLAVLSLLSFSCVLPAPTDPWYQRAWQSIRPYFGWIVGGSVTGAAAGAGIAQRYKMNPCVGAACGAVAGGLLAGGGSAFLSSRVDKEAEEYVQKLSTIISTFASQVGMDENVFTNNENKYVKAILQNKYAPSVEDYNRLTTVSERFKALTDPWMTLRDNISQGIFYVFKGNIEKMLIFARLPQNWNNIRLIVQHVNNIMSPQLDVPLVQYNYADEPYSVDKINELIEKVTAL